MSAAAMVAEGHAPLASAELLAQGKALRRECPRGRHKAWSPPDDRRNPVSLIEACNEGREAELIPIRHGRMLRSPFALSRGAAAIMAADLAGTPSTGARVQACGDGHLLNFGGFGTPEPRQILDINDFDETLPAPWERDVKRLAASFAVACRDAGFRESTARDAAGSCARSHRKRMAECRSARAGGVVREHRHRHGGRGGVMRAQREHRRRWLWAMAGLVLAGCASGERAAAPRTRVPLTDVSPIVGRWDGLISGLSSAPSVEQDLVDVVIKSDATYEAKAYRTVGAFKGRGTIALKDGSAIFRGTDGDTATGQLFDVGGSRVLEIETTGSGGRRLTARLSPRR